MRPPQPPLADKVEAVMDFLSGQNALSPEIVAMPQNSFTDVMVVAGATSRRHAQGLADGLGRLCHANGYEYAGMEGYDTAQWILVDCNELVVNIFLEDVRAMYRLEELWAHAAQPKEKRS